MRFTTRDLLWLTVVVGMGVMWWGEYRQRMSESSDLRADYQRLLQERDRLLNAHNTRFGEAQRRVIEKLLEERAALRKASPEKD